MDCGLACLAMVIKHAGRDPDIEQIRSDCASALDKWRGIWSSQIFFVSLQIQTTAEWSSGSSLGS